MFPADPNTFYKFALKPDMIKIDLTNGDVLVLSGS